MKYTANQLAKMAINSDPRCVKDRLYFLAWCNARQIYTFCFDEEGIREEYIRLLNKVDPFTLERERERYLEQHPEIEPTYVSTEKLRRELLGGEVPLL